MLAGLFAGLIMQPRRLKRNFGTARLPEWRGTASAWPVWAVLPERVLLALSSQYATVTTQVPEQPFAFHPTTTSSC